MIHTGDCLKVLQTLAGGSVDAVITDPPYSSGGQFRNDRVQSVASKYVSSGTERFAKAGFSGDNRDQRSWAFWCAMWLSECRRVTRPAGYCLMFCDWRQLPTTTDIFQAGGWIWRGVIAWDKGLASRAPHTGYFRHQCEYVVWGTNGPTDKGQVRGGPWPGCFHVPVVQSDKHHVTGKPTRLLRSLVACCTPGGVVLDPFAGSGTTGVACALEGRQFVGIEENADYVAVAERRIAAALEGSEEEDAL